MKEYGLLVYDVKIGNSKTYFQIRSIVQKHSIPINYSVYLVDWGLKKVLEKRLNKVNNNVVNWKMVKFDPSSNAELEQIAKESLKRLINELKETIKQKVTKVIDSEKREGIVRRYVRKLLNLKKLILIYSFANEEEQIKLLLRETEGIIKTECELLGIKLNKRRKEV